MAHRIGFFVFAALLLHASTIAAASEDDSCASSAPALPAWVSVPEDLQPHVQSMLSASATFRAQCQRIAAARSLVVLMQIDPGLVDRSYRAQTWFGRTPAGVIVARVSISLRTSPVEWIAHEIEHVVEQVEGLRLATLAVQRRGVWLSSDKTFETTRAIDAGRAVVAEMHRAGRRRRQDNIVE